MNTAPPTPTIVPNPLEAPIISVPTGDAADRPFPRHAQLCRVLHVVNGEHFSGAERVQSHLGRKLPGEGFAADFACVKPGRFYDRLNGRPDEGRAIDARMNGRFDFAAATRLSELVRDGGYELLHAHTPRTAMLAARVAGRLSLPWVYHVHSPTARDSGRRILNAINARVEKRSAKRADALVTVSESLKRQCVADGYDPTRVHVVPNGVPAVDVRRKPDPVPGGRWVIGMIALHRPRKGLEVAVDALRLLVDAGHDVILRCIGPFETGEYRDRIEAHVDRSGIRRSFEFIGFTDNVPAALAAMDVMVLPSLYGEGMPMVVLESLAAGTPVVATHVEGTPEVITDGCEGLLAEPGSSASLAGCLSRLLTGDASWPAMSAAAEDRHRQRFSDTAMAAATADVYRRVLG